MKSGAIALAIALATAAAPAYAAGGGGGGGGGGAGPSHPCKAGQVYSPQANKCVPSNAGLLDDKQLFTEARALALDGYYEDALDILAKVKNQHDDMVLTYVGYSKRKLGMVDDGIAYYHQALAINPNNLNTREYLGEGYVAAGRTDLAVAELNKLEALCGTECDQYEQLELAIAGTPEHW
jgi:tetratricopeptide (TPR) repeat protein